MASILPYFTVLAGQSASVTLERHRHSHQLSPRVTWASLQRRTNSLPCATVFGCVVFEFCEERNVYLCQLEDHSKTLLGETTKGDDKIWNFLLEVGILPDVLLENVRFFFSRSGSWWLFVAFVWAQSGSALLFDFVACRRQMFTTRTFNVLV